MAIKALATNSDNWLGRKGNFSKIEQGQNATQVFSQLGVLDSKVEKLPTFYEYDGQAFPTGETRLVTTKVPWGNGIQPLKRSVVSYKPIQNFEFAKTFDSLNNIYNLAGGGVLGNRGQFTFLQFEAGDYEIGGLENEKHKSYFLAYDNKEVGGIGFGYVEMRVFCENVATDNLDLIKIPHSTDGLALIQFVAELQHKVATYQNIRVSTLNKMFKTPLQKGQMNTLAEAVFPTPTKPKRLAFFENNSDYIDGSKLQQKATEGYEKTLETVEKRRQALVDEFFTFNAITENKPASGTVYAAYQAVTSMGNYSSCFNNQDDALASLFVGGVREKVQTLGWEACVALC